ARRRGLPSCRACVHRGVCGGENARGSRGGVFFGRGEGAAPRRFGISGDGAGVCYTRMGRRFFADRQLEAALIDEVRKAVTAAGFWSEFNTDWVILDCELMPWSGKAQGLILKQYASTRTAPCAA